MARIIGKTQVQLPEWLYISGISVVNPNDQAVVLPSEATIVSLDAENAECYYAINTAIAGVTSGGYVPAEAGRIVGPLGNLDTLRVHGPACTVHIQFFREA